MNRLKRALLGVRMAATIRRGFDPDFYLSCYGDVPRARPRRNALRHFLRYGDHENRDPAPWFSTTDYRNLNADVKASGINAFYHYLRFGKSEGRLCVPSAAGADGEANVAEFQAEAIRGEFDAQYYRRMNPDLIRVNDLVLHYARSGWHQGRDPMAEFSSSGYLTANPDIAAAGVNPFFHYITAGRAQGRPAIAATGEVTLAPTTLSGVSAADLRAGVVVMMRNEADIAELFFAHLLALFDVIVVVDHGSVDGTREFLSALSAADNRVHVYDLQEPGYIQAQLMNHMIRDCPELEAVDWVFLLDADEFLPFASRDEFRDVLEWNAPFPVIAMNWSNLIPLSYWKNKVCWDGETRFFEAPQRSVFRKIAFQRAAFAGGAGWVTQGNHAIETVRNGLPEKPRATEFSLLHLPVRSAKQIVQKLRQGEKSYADMGPQRQAQEGAHWSVLLRQVKDGNIESRQLNAMVWQYSGDAGVARISGPELLARGYVEKTFHPAQETLPVALVPATAPGADPGAAECVDLPLKMAAVEHLITGADGAIARRSGDFSHVYATLPECASDDDGEDESAAGVAGVLAAFFGASHGEIADLTPTSWGGHIPFLFSLVAAEQPRRFAELGSYFGASFCAFCQGVNTSGFDCEAIAIDCWEGDLHTGAYDENVLKGFLWRLRKYRHFAGYLRMFFNEAAGRFGPGSLDLLHIDGLHSYDAVREDFETWQPKMSDRGIILFHDTNVFQENFGVWKLWDEIKDQYPSMDFIHNHGLGVLYTGRPQGRPIEKLIGVFNSGMAGKELIRRHYEQVSERSLKLAGDKARLREAAGERVKSGWYAQEINRLTQALEIAGLERQKLRELVK